MCRFEQKIAKKFDGKLENVKIFTIYVYEKARVGGTTAVGLEGGSAPLTINTECETSGPGFIASAHLQCPPNAKGEFVLIQRTRYEWIADGIVQRKLFVNEVSIVFGPDD